MGLSTTMNPLGLKEIHHVEFWVGNAKQAAFFFRNAFGFSGKAYRGLETNERNCSSHVIAQDEATFVFTSPLNSSGPINDHLNLHGDGVRDIAFHVEDADHAYQHAIEQGAIGETEPHEVVDNYGRIRRAAIRTYGDTIHSLISYEDYSGPFLPGYQPQVIPGKSCGIKRVDHIVGNVELGKMNHWADWYTDVMGFERYISFDDKDISTEYSALMSIVMSDNSYSIKFPINEPAEGRKKSQIDEYLEYYNGPGVQHLAMLTDDILETVRSLRERGVEFLSVPETYYQNLPDRIGEIDETIKAIAELGILADRDEDGYLLQLFTKPVQDRPTVFLELIQRKGSRGFGKGNFKALFEAIEHEQSLRGNL